MDLNSLQMLGNLSPSRAPSVQQGKSDDKGLREACKEFESILIEQMLKSMRKTVEKSELMHGGQAEEIFEDMLYEKYARKMSDSANLGLSDMLYRQLSQNNTLTE